MKRTVLASAIFLMAMVAAGARDFQKNIFSIHAGVNIGTAMMESGAGKFFTEPQAGLYAGGSYQRLLSDIVPVYFETGADISQYGYKITESAGFSRFSIWYLQVPLMVNYKFALGNFTLYPGIGVVGSFGMAGFSEQEYEYSDFQTGEKTMLTDRYRVFGDFDSRTGQGGYLRRADIGLRGSVHAGWKRVSIGIAYTVGFMNLANTGEKGVYPDGTVIKDFGTLTISAGFSF